MSKKKSKPKNTQPKKPSAKAQEVSKDVEKREIVPSEEISGLSDELLTKLSLDDNPGDLETKVIDSDLKNNNLTPEKSDEALPDETVPDLSSPGRGPDTTDQTQKRDLFEVPYFSKVNYNNNVSGDVKDLEVGEKKAEAVLPLKHPLEHTWTFWWFSNTSKSWQAEKIISFSTIEDFWSAYNWILPASQLEVNSDYAVFKEGTKPDWEDPNNARGGRWVVERNVIEDMDRFWLETLFMLIGEHIQPYSNLINGAVVQKKKGKFRLAVWLKDASKWSDRGISSIGQHLRRQINIVDSDLMDFRVHSSEQKRPVGRPSGKVIF